MNHFSASSLRRALLASASVAIIVLGTSHAWSVSTRVGSDFTESMSPVCDGAAVCRVVFAAVAANTIKLVTNVSCEVKAIDKDAQLYDSTLGKGTGPLQMPYTSLVPVVVGTFSSNTRFFKMNNSAYHVFSAGQIPQVFLRMGGGTFSNATCTISGVIKSVVT